MTQENTCPLLAWEDGPHSSCRGKARSTELFSIHLSSRRTGPKWLLRSHLPGMTVIPAGQDSAAGPDELKARAEAILAVWLARIGAATPARMVEVAGGLWRPELGRGTAELMAELIVRAVRLEGPAVTVEIFDAIAREAAGLESPSQHTGQGTGQEDK